jgi:hypothetical protein
MNSEYKQKLEELLVKLEAALIKIRQRKKYQ